MYYVTKTYDHSLGLSACFRQWRAESHCRFLHGYALSFKLTFAAHTLDCNNWVFNFGGLKPVKAFLEQHFDHKLVVAADDPQLERLQALDPFRMQTINDDVVRVYQVGEPNKLASVLVLPWVGCEGFATFVANHVRSWLDVEYTEDVLKRGLRLVSVEVREHGGNSAIYELEA